MPAEYCRHCTKQIVVSNSFITLDTSIYHTDNFIKDCLTSTDVLHEL